MHISRDGNAYVVRADPGEKNYFGIRVDSFDTKRISFSDRTTDTVMTADPALGCELFITGFGRFASCPVVGTTITTARLEAGDGDDELDVSPFDLPLKDPITFDGGPGNDDLEGPTEALPMILKGGDGNDKVMGGHGADVLEGGAGDDRVDGGDADDTVAGGAGDDVVSGGRTFSTDVIDGGPGRDTVANDWTDGTSIVVTLDGVADDGRPGENDNVLSIDSIETRRIATLVAGNDPVDFSVTNTPAGNSKLIGSPGNDKLRSGAYDDRVEGRGGADAIAAGGGNDSIDGGPGPDVILADGGAICDFISCSENQQGNDVIDARDGERDSIDCGPGTDTATVDPIDVLAGCEIVNGQAAGTPPGGGGSGGNGNGSGNGGGGGGNGGGGSGGGGGGSDAAGCTVPKIARGATLSSARKALDRAGCKRTTKKVRSTSVRAGRVVRITRREGKKDRVVKAGTKLAGSTVVTVVVSRGR